MKLLINREWILDQRGMRLEQTIDKTTTIDQQGMNEVSTTTIDQQGMKLAQEWS